MSASISDSAGKMIFQGDMAANIRRINKVDYAVFEGQYDNGAVAVDFAIRMKIGYIKKAPMDLIKNDHIIFQKRDPMFFFLFEADKEKFVREGEDLETFEESGRSNNYTYRISFRNNLKAKPKKAHSRLGGRAGEMMDEINALLEKNGIHEADPSSPVSEYMKTWKLGHPDGE